MGVEKLGYFERDVTVTVLSPTATGTYISAATTSQTQWTLDAKSIYIGWCHAQTHHINWAYGGETATDGGVWISPTVWSNSSDSSTTSYLNGKCFITGDSTVSVMFRNAWQLSKVATWARPNPVLSGKAYRPIFVSYMNYTYAGSPSIGVSGSVLQTAYTLTASNAVWKGYSDGTNHRGQIDDYWWLIWAVPTSGPTASTAITFTFGATQAFCDYTGGASGGQSTQYWSSTTFSLNQTASWAANPRVRFARSDQWGDVYVFGSELRTYFGTTTAYNR